MFAEALLFPIFYIVFICAYVYVGYKILAWAIRKLFNTKERSSHDYLYETLDKYNDSLI